MRITRFHTLPNGNSAFDEVDLPVENASTDGFGNALKFSSAFASPAVRVFEAPVGMFQGWHNAPCRQICVMMQGVWEIGITNGDRRRWGPGDVFMPDTVQGKGHTSEVIQGPVRMFFIPLPDDLDIETWSV